MRDKGILEQHIDLVQVITEQRATAGVEEKSNADAMAENAPVLIWRADTENRGTWFNRAWLEFTGRTMEQELGYGWAETVHPDDQAPAVAFCQYHLERREPFEMEFRMRRYDGKYRWVLDRGVPVFDGPARVFSGYIGSCIDITERKRAEEALRESEERFRQLADAMPQIVWAARPDGHLDYYNRRWYELTVAGESQTGDQSWLPVLHPEDRQRCLDTWYECVRTGAAYQIEYRFKLQGSNEYRWHLGRALPVRNAAGDIVRWFGTSTDVHELRSAREALRESDRRKDDFLATLAHELRNPLAPISNALQMMRMQKNLPDAKLRRVREMIERQVQHMVRLVDDLLEVSRITTGRIDLRIEHLDLVTVLRNAAEASQPLIDASGHQFVLQLPAEPIYVEADSTRLSQVILNLLNNAAKYTPQGGRIELTACREGGRVAVHVLDNGLGVRPEMLPRIFDMFVQGERHGVRSRSGLGVGLTLARRLTELHGGRIDVRSAGPGKGSEFIVHLPASPDEHAELATGPTKPKILSSPHRILVVDDNVDAADSLCMNLQLMHHEVQTAYSGIAALKTAATFEPDVVVLDIGLPDKDGYQVARQLRRSARGRQLVLIALTGWGQEEDKQRARAAGFDEHLTKPFDAALLLQVISGGLAPARLVE